MKHIRVFAMCVFFSAVSCDMLTDTDPYVSFSWNESSPVTQNMSTVKLDSALLQAGLLGFADGLLVIRNGSVVAERYYNGYTETTPHNVMSVSKSFLSALTGLALELGHIDSLEQSMLQYFPEYIYQDMDPRKHDITLRHLLTMRMGIRGEAEEDYRVYHRLYTSDNWIKNTIEEPLVFSPGEHMAYNTFQTHLLSAIITKASSQNTRDFARANLLYPCGIDVHEWEQGPQGYYFGGNSMFFTPREMAVLGYVYLHKGMLDGRRIIPEEWIDLTLTASTNRTHPNAWGELKNYNYAYLWWLGQIGGRDMFMGYGYGGQFLIVFPAENLIVVTTARSGVDGNTSTQQEWALFNIVARYIVPALQD